VLRDHHPSGGRERRGDVNDINSAGFWGCIPGGSARVTSQQRGGVLY